MLYSTHTWDLVQALESASPASCKTPSTSIESIRSNNHPRRNKKSWKKIKHLINCIILPWPTYTEPGLTEVDLEFSPNRGSDKINRLRPRRKNITEHKLPCTAWTHKWWHYLLVHYLSSSDCKLDEQFHNFQYNQCNQNSLDCQLNFDYTVSMPDLLYLPMVQVYLCYSGMKEDYLIVSHAHCKMGRIIKLMSKLFPTWHLKLQQRLQRFLFSLEFISFKWVILLWLRST